MFKPQPQTWPWLWETELLTAPVWPCSQATTQNENKQCNLEIFHNTIFVSWPTLLVASPLYETSCFSGRWLHFVDAIHACRQWVKDYLASETNLSCLLQIKTYREIYYDFIIRRDSFPTVIKANASMAQVRWSYLHSFTPIKMQSIWNQRA